MNRQRSRMRKSLQRLGVLLLAAIPVGCEQGVPTASLAPDAPATLHHQPILPETVVPGGNLYPESVHVCKFGPPNTNFDYTASASRTLTKLLATFDLMDAECEMVAQGGGAEYTVTATETLRLDFVLDSILVYNAVFTSGDQPFVATWDTTRITDSNSATGTASGGRADGSLLGSLIVFYNSAAAPSIDIEKHTNGQDADTPTGPEIPVGGAVNWEYFVTNTGNVTLTNVAVTDDQGVVVTCPKTPLAPAESMTCTGNGTATAGQYANIGTATGKHNGTTVEDTDPSHYLGIAPAGATLLIIDEDGIDNGLHLNRTGGWITPSGPSFWTDREVNDDIADYGLRSVLRYFADSRNWDKTITVRTGQTGDEGWFAPNCIPRKWLSSSVSSSDNTCMTLADRTTGIHNLFFSGKTPFTGAPSSWNIPQSRLDKIPHVRPLRALGIQTLVGQNVCALVYDSDISINYDHGTPLGVNGNLQGATLGIAAFKVESAHTLNNFSSSTLPQVRITPLDPSETCKNLRLYDAPVPTSSSVPNDRVVPSTFTTTGSSSYRSIATVNVFH
jgi:hypothetical protein